MRNYLSYIPLGSGFFTFFCFSLPWIHDESGIVLANSDDGWLITVAFIASIVIVVNSFIQGTRQVNNISSYIGLLCLIPLFFYRFLNLNLEILTSYPVSIRYGVFLTAIGFFCTIVGTINFVKKTDRSDRNGDPNSQGGEK